MSGLHLNHKLSWSDLKSLVTVYSQPGLELPVGDCGLIHLENKKIQLQVNHRKYLNDQICTKPGCSVTQNKIFRKNLKQKYSLDRLCYKIYNPYPGEKDTRDGHLHYFLKCFQEAVNEFADTERKKYSAKRTRVKDAESKERYILQVTEMLKKKHSDLEAVKNLTKYGFGWHCRCCELFRILMETNEIETLLGFSDEEILSVFKCHPTQAVGRNWEYLTWSICKVYLHTNLIVAFGLENDPELWGVMKSTWDLMHDCDAQTFLEGSRKYLKDDVYMKDFDAMKELCKNCFKFLYISQMLGKEVGIDFLSGYCPWYN